MCIDGSYVGPWGVRCSICFLLEGALVQGQSKLCSLCVLTEGTLLQGDCLILCVYSKRVHWYRGE